MNWGKGITLAFILFAAFIGTLVVIAVRTDFYLVSDDYYDQEIKYEAQIQRIRANEELAKKIKFEYDKKSKSASITLPEELLDKKIEGTLHFFRPSDANMDQILDLDFDEDGKMNLNLSKIQTGLWRLKISYSTDDKVEFYDERVLIL